MRHVALVCLLFLSIGLPGYGKQRTSVWVQETPTVLTAPTAVNLDQWFDQSKAVLYHAHVLDLLDATTGRCASAANDLQKCAGTDKPTFPGSDDYIIIHVVLWKDLVSGKSVQDVDKQNWYVYNGSNKWDDDAFAKDNRVFGQKKVYVLYVHFNRDPKALYQTRYTLTSKSKTPAYLDHFTALGKLFGLGKAGGEKLTKGPQVVWGEYRFDDLYVPADLTLSAEVIPPPDTVNPFASVTLDTKTFDNEGRYHTDFSVGVPIRKISELSYVSASNTIVPTSVQKQNLLALFDYYPRAFDIKSSGWDPYPHLVTGVALASQPLKKVLVGVGYGPIYANFYAGLLLHTYRIPMGTSCGVIPTSAQLAAGKLTNHTCAEFSFGLNVAVGAIADALKTKK